jgi:hypothetical protein
MISLLGPAHGRPRPRDAMIEDGGVPGKVEVDQHGDGLQVQADSAGIGADEHLQHRVIAGPYGPVLRKRPACTDFFVQHICLGAGSGCPVVSGVRFDAINSAMTGQIPASPHNREDDRPCAISVSAVRRVNAGCCRC